MDKVIKSMEIIVGELQFLEYEKVNKQKLNKCFDLIMDIKKQYGGNTI